MPGDRIYHPPLTDRITIALRGLKAARLSGDCTAELGYETLLNRLIDRYLDGER